MWSISVVYSKPIKFYTAECSISERLMKNKLVRSVTVKKNSGY